MLKGFPDHTLETRARENIGSEVSQSVAMYPDVVLPVGESGAWDSGGVCAPLVFLDPTDGGMKMLYLGFSDESTTGFPRKLGLATSQNGFKWTKYAGNPVLSASSGDSFEFGGLIYHATLEQWWLYITYWPNVTTGERYVKRYTSTDLITWTDAGTVIEPGADGSYDENGAWCLVPLTLPAFSPPYMAFYIAKGRLKDESGTDVLAKTFLCKAYSSNLTTWTKHSENPAYIRGIGEIMELHQPQFYQGYILILIEVCVSAAKWELRPGFMYARCVPSSTGENQGAIGMSETSLFSLPDSTIRGQGRGLVHPHFCWIKGQPVMYFVIVDGFSSAEKHEIYAAYIEPGFLVPQRHRLHYWLWHRKSLSAAGTTNCVIGDVSRKTFYFWADQNGTIEVRGDLSRNINFIAYKTLISESYTADSLWTKQTDLPASRMSLKFTPDATPALCYAFAFTEPL